jgi:hypothetical protein
VEEDEFSWLLLGNGLLRQVKMNSAWIARPAYFRSRLHLFKSTAVFRSFLNFLRMAITFRNFSDLYPHVELTRKSPGGMDSSHPFTGPNDEIPKHEQRYSTDIVLRTLADAELSNGGLTLVIPPSQEILFLDSVSRYRMEDES